MKEKIRREIDDFVGTSPLNKMEEFAGSYYDVPLVGFADAKDPYFRELKAIIGDFHMTPEEFFDHSFGAGSFRGGTVVVWVLPFSIALRDRSRPCTSLPSKEWAHGRYYGEMFNEELRRHVVDFLLRQGYPTLAPSLSPAWERLQDPRVGHASRWSERHAAHAAGLGTFSLSDGLITARGIAHRVGSVVTELAVAADKRPYRGPYDYCLKYNSATCGACITRCPSGALSEKGHDKDRCYEYIRQVVMPSVNDAYRVSTPSCGLCQVGVPCESRIPERDRMQAI
jgi:ferredoxin